MWYLRIPKDRIAVLIGTNGKVRKRIEEKTGVTIQIDSKTGEINIDPENADPVMALKARDMVKAIGRGFSPERAEALLNEDVYLQIIDIRDYTGKNRNRVRRMRGRVIGRKGKTRRLIEEYSEAEISIYGNTIGIIGDPWALEVAREAIHMLLSGSEHGTVYRFLERKRRELKQKRFQELISGSF